MTLNLMEQALAKVKRSLGTVFCFSAVANILLLTSPLFMLQVYDRVLISRSEETLLALICVAAFALVILYVLEVVRNRLLVRVSFRFDRDTANATFTQLLTHSASSQPAHELNTIRQFIASPFVLALFDMPWIPLYLGVVYFLHPLLGHIALVAVIILFITAFVNDRSTRDHQLKASQYFSNANRFVEHSVRHKDASIGMGMTPALGRHWQGLQQGGLGFHARVSDRNSALASFAKVFRQFVQVCILAMGAFLTIQDLSTAGVMIAASIIAARALAPVEQSIQGWRGFTNAKQSAAYLMDFMAGYEHAKRRTQLPVPNGHITLHNVFAIPAIDGEGESGEEPLIRNISLRVEPGKVLGIAGPSGSGKSTLMRLMAGIISPLRGTVRIDGAELTPEVQQQFASHIGYLPQDVELFDGTVAENIARFQEVDDEAIITASRLSGAHDVILELKHGYETEVGPGGSNLSGGQRQRIGLARALFGSPRLLFLDEPSSNLDEPGTLALIGAIEKMKQEGVSIILIAHHPRLFLLTDQLAVLKRGVLEMFGPSKEILDKLGVPQVASGASKASHDRTRTQNARGGDGGTGAQRQ